MRHYALRSRSVLSVPVAWQVVLDELHYDHRWVDAVQAMELVCNVYGVDYSRAERHSLKITTTTRCPGPRTQGLAAPVLDLHSS